jgi:hypothetical protein
VVFSVGALMLGLYALKLLARPKGLAAEPAADVHATAGDD